ncbi:lipopolysaccharide biosynthesis protein [Thermococcus sp.]
MSYERRVLIRHSIASIIALGLTGLSRFIYNIVIARKFGVEELGRANSLLSQAFFIAIPLSFFAIALGKYSSEFLGRGDTDAIRSITLPSFLLPLAGFFLLPFNVYLGLIAVFRGIQLTLRSFLYGIHRGEHYAYLIAASFLAFLEGFAFSNVFAPYLLFLGMVSMFAFVYLGRTGFVGRPKSEHIRLLISYSLFAFLGTLSGVFLIQGPYFLSEYLGSPELAGSVAAILSTAFLLTYLPQVLQSAIMPLFSYKHGRGEPGYVKSLAEKTTAFLILVTGVIVFAMMLVGRGILSFLFKFEIGPAFYLALMAIEVYIVYNPSLVALNSTAYVRRGTLLSLAGAVVSGILWVLLIPSVGEIGVMLGLIGGYLVILGGTAVSSSRLLGIRPRIYLPLFSLLLLQSFAFLSKYALLAGLVIFLIMEKETVKEGMDLLKSFRGRGS